MSTIAITNPSDESAEAGFVYSQVAHITAESIIPEYGDKIEDGAQIVIFTDGENPRVWQYIAERVDDDIWIRNNNTTGLYIDCEDVGAVIESGTVEGTLEVYTVFGENDDAEPFRAVLTARSPAAAKAAGITAGTVDVGCEHMVRVDAVLKGDVTDADVTPEANQGE